jgi:hypothetical protein
MFTQSRIDIDPGVSLEVVKLFKELDHGRGGALGTWHGSRMRDNPYEWFDTTFARVQATVGDRRIEQWWFNCGEPGDEYRWHAHNPYTHSAVLYVQVPDDSGGIEFRRYEEYQVFQPTAGDFIQFAGNLAHRVLPNLSLDYRISVAFNFKS